MAYAMQATRSYVCPYTVGDIDVPVELQPFIEGYLQRREAELMELRILIENRDYDAVGRIAHKLSGNGASYGLFVLTEIARDMQLEIQNKNFDELPIFVDHLHEVLREIRRRMVKSTKESA